VTRGITNVAADNPHSIEPVRREIHYRPSQGQSPKLRDVAVREQWRWIQTFFARCTDSHPFARDATLEISVSDFVKHRASFDSAMQEATRLFGEAKVEPDLLHPEDATWQWPIQPAQAEAAVEFMARGEPWMRPGTRPVKIFFYSMFSLRDPASGAILPRQTPVAERAYGRTSSIMCSIGPRPWIYPLFVFPFPRVTERFLSFLAAFSEPLPFRLGPRHFRSIRPVTGDLREHIGFLSPEDDERIRQAQQRRTKASAHPRRNRKG
jgi:hypothetical protein